MEKKDLLPKIEAILEKIKSLTGFSQDVIVKEMGYGDTYISTAINRGGNATFLKALEIYYEKKITENNNKFETLNTMPSLPTEKDKETNSISYQNLTETTRLLAEAQLKRIDVELAETKVRQTVADSSATLIMILAKNANSSAPQELPLALVETMDRMMKSTAKMLEKSLEEPWQDIFHKLRKQTYDIPTIPEEVDKIHNHGNSGKG